MYERIYSMEIKVNELLRSTKTISVSCLNLTFTEASNDIHCCTKELLGFLLFDGILQKRYGVRRARYSFDIINTKFLAARA